MHMPPSRRQTAPAQVSHALQQLNGDVTLEVPELPTDSVEKAAADTELVMSLEQYMSEWSSTLASVMQVRVRVHVCAGVRDMHRYACCTSMSEWSSMLASVMSACKCVRIGVHTCVLCASVCLIAQRVSACGPGSHVCVCVCCWYGHGARPWALPATAAPAA